MKTFDTLNDLMAHLGTATPADLGLNNYRHAGGINTQFNVITSKPFSALLNVTITLNKGKLHAAMEETMDDVVNNMAQDALSFLGFHPDGSLRCPAKMPRSLKAYSEKVRGFFNRKPSFGVGRKFIGVVRPTHPYSGEPNNRAVFIQLIKDVPAGMETINYTDTKAHGTLEGCTGLNFTSIVEGSDVEVDGYFLNFPFSEKDYEDTLKNINAEVSFYWDRDNVDTYQVTYRGEDYYFDNDGKKNSLPAGIQREVLAFVNSEESWNISGSVNGPDEDGDMTLVPNTNATIEKVDKSCHTF